MSSHYSGHLRSSQRDASELKNKKKRLKFFLGTFTVDEAQWLDLNPSRSIGVSATFDSDK